MPQIGYAHRQAPMGRRGMVAACHPLASLAGVEVLKSGGNVVDAAIATNAVLAVTQPNFCGVGGDLFCLYYEAATRRVHFLNGAGRSGARATLDELGAARPRPRCRAYGPGSVSVPGVTRGVAHAARALRHAPARRPARAGRALRGRGLPALATSSRRRSASARPATTIRSGGASSCPAASSRRPASASASPTWRAR